MSPKRLYLVVAAAAVVVYLGALWNRFALDDTYLIVANPLVRSGDGWWRAFVSPYWPPDWGGKMYRPLPIASFALDWITASTAWFHFVNLLWHAGATVSVAALARRLSGERAALVAGLLFAVHPVHVEAVANVVGRAELMAGLFSVLAVYAALARGSVGWSAAALTLGLLSKENAAVTPGLIVWAWIAGLGRPSRAGMVRFGVSWLVLGALYVGVRWWVVHPYARIETLAPVFAGEDAVTVRLTAVAALADIGRLLVFPLTLRADYSPAERTALHTPLDPRFGLGLLTWAVWAAVLAWAWRRGRKVEAFGLGWIGIALLPVANLLFPSGVLVAERTLYLPSVGLVLAAAAFIAPDRVPVRWQVALAVLLLAGGIRTVLRVPVWRDDIAVTESVLEDSPRSYSGYSRSGGLLLSAGRAAKALEAFQHAAAIHDRDAAVFIAAADAAFTLGMPALADSLLGHADRFCVACPGLYRVQAAAARSRGDLASADWLLAHAQGLESP